MTEEAVAREGEQPSESLGDELARVLDLEPAVQSEPEAREGEDETVQTSEETQEEATEEGIGRFTDLIRLFDKGTTEQDLYSLEVVSAGDGHKVTVGDLKDMYQQRQDFETERAEFERKRNEQLEQLEQAKQQAALTVGPDQISNELVDARADIRRIEEEAKAVNWTNLEQEDPGQAALARQKFKDAYDASKRRYNETVQKVSAERDRAYNAFIAKQWEELLRRVPDWRTAETYKAETDGLKSFAAAYGYTPEDVDGIADARYLHVLRDYMVLKTKVDQATAQAKQIKERGNRVLKPSLRPKTQSRSTEAIERGKRPGATKHEQFEAAKALLDGVL